MKGNGHRWWTEGVCLLAAVASVSGAQAQEEAPAESQSSSLERAAPVEDPPPQAPSPPAALPAPSPSPATGFSRSGDVSIGVSFGIQGSAYGREAAGLRFGLSDSLFTGLYLHHSHEESKNLEAYGAHLEFGIDVLSHGRTALSVVPVVAYGVNNDASNTLTEQWGASLGLQLEVRLLRELSLAARTEWGGQLAPESERRLSTASGELVVFLHLPGD